MDTVTDWSLYPNFSRENMRCKHTGKDGMNSSFMARLQRLRTAFGKPMPITSGFRDRTHPIEARKGTAGPHTTGRAVDVSIRGADALQLIALALQHGFTGIGLKQHGNSRFVHLDDLEATPTQPRPTVWTYP